MKNVTQFIRGGYECAACPSGYTVIDFGLPHGPGLRTEFVT
jgi:hypothetical protein